MATIAPDPEMRQTGGQILDGHPRRQVLRFEAEKVRMRPCLPETQASRCLADSTLGLASAVGASAAQRELGQGGVNHVVVGFGHEILQNTPENFVTARTGRGGRSTPLCRLRGGLHRRRGQKPRRTAQQPPPSPRPGVEVEVAGSGAGAGAGAAGSEAATGTAPAVAGPAAGRAAGVDRQTSGPRGEVAQRMGSFKTAHGESGRGGTGEKA